MGKEMGGRGCCFYLLISLLPFSTAGIFTQKVVWFHSSRSLARSLAHSLSFTQSQTLSSAHTHTLFCSHSRVPKTTPLGRFSHGVLTFPSAMTDLKQGKLSVNTIEHMFHLQKSVIKTEKQQESINLNNTRSLFNALWPSCIIPEQISTGVVLWWW